MTMPEAYTTPLTKRAEIAAYLLNRRGRYYRDHGHLLFVFNCKVYVPDLEFDHLLDLHRHSGYGEAKTTDAFWIEEARQRHAETDQGDLYQWAIEDAGRLVTESDCFNHLYDGTPVEAEYAFVGRSGGWIALTMFEGVKLVDPDYLRDLFEGDQDDGDTPTLSDELLHHLYALAPNGFFRCRPYLPHWRCLKKPEKTAVFENLRLEKRSRVSKRLHFG